MRLSGLEATYCLVIVWRGVITILYDAVTVCELVASAQPSTVSTRLWEQLRFSECRARNALEGVIHPRPGYMFLMLD
jgi:hypothetical protein